MDFEGNSHGLIEIASCMEGLKKCTKVRIFPDKIAGVLART
jgi:hypothetical protein